MRLYDLKPKRELDIPVLEVIMPVNGRFAAAVDYEATTSAKSRPATTTTRCRGDEQGEEKDSGANERSHILP